MIIHRLTEALSPLAGGRVFFQVLPEGKLKYPAMVIQFAGITPNSALEDADLDNYRVQVDVYSGDPAELMTLRKLAETAVTESIPFSHRISSEFGFEPDTKLHRLILEFNISSDE
ncbi:DUF3168 domain-containing protein [Morganella morganii]|uniref:DUF3168 domain-containing protein n=1 Tax=Morganella morganii TaxID=582 RepID=UPI00052C613D|nr:DUF3168 domain-containing protein [Morganella morganii]KGP42013.1 hypothetical protein LR61_20380 [Morganella morganii]